MWIGTIQGYKDGLDNAKIVTKKMFGYRPKNFIMFLLRHIAAICKVESIYAVSDEGFYANTHLVRGHRANVAELDSLWEESGGVLCSDERFFKSHKNVANIVNAMNYSINMNKKFKNI